MPSVDNRVVEMRFDNKDFEAGVSTSLSTLDKLKKSLNFKDASKGFDELDHAAKKVDFSSLADAIELVTKKFSPLGVIGDQVLRRIGDAVADVEHKVISLVKSMSVDQISAGWTKLNQKTQSVQTIMNATGLSIDEVNQKLDRLMWYSDETSFGFTDMTAALETMTAKGGDIEKLIPMLMGFGNAVAYSGKSSAEFQRVLRYGLSQAYSLGYLGTRDWYSFTGAGVGSSQLQKLLLKWANELEGTAYDAGEGFGAAFSEALKDKAITNRVMESAFNEFAEMTLEAERLIEEGVYDNATEAYAALSDQFDDFRGKSAKAAQQAKSFAEVIDAVKDAVSTGWMVTFEEIFGDLNEQVELWSWLVEEFLEVFAYGAEDRNNVLQAWHDGVEILKEDQADLAKAMQENDPELFAKKWASGKFKKTVSGYQLMLEALENVWYAFKDILYSVKAAWESVFPPITAERLVAITQKVRDVSASLREMFVYVEEKTDPIRKLFGGAKEGAEEATEAIEQTSQSLDELAYAVIRGEYGNAPTRFEAIGAGWKLVQNRVNELLGNSWRYTLTAEEEVEAMKALGGETESVTEATEELTEEMGESTPAIKAIQGVIRGMAGAVSILKQTASALWTKVAKPALKGILKLLTPVFNKISEIGNKIADIAKEWEENGKIEEFLDKVVNVFNRIAAPFKTFAAKVKEIIDRVKQSQAFQDFTEKLGQLGDVLKDIGGQVGEKVLSLFDSLNKSTSGNTWVDTVVGTLEKGLTFLNSLLDEIIPKLQKVNLDNLGELFNGLSVEAGTIQSFFKNPLSFMTNLFSNFDPLSGFDETLDSFFGSLTGKTDEVEEAADAVEDFGDAAEEASTGILGFTDNISSFINSIDFSSIESSGTSMISMFSGLGESLSGITSNVKLTDIVAVLGALSAIGVASSFKKVGKAAATTFSTITSFFNTMKRRQPIPILLQIAIAVMAVAGAMMMIASIDDKKLKNVIDAMIQIFISLWSLVVTIGVMSRIMGDKGARGATGLGVAIAAMAASFLIIAYALKVLQDVNTDGLLGKIGIIGLVMLEMAAISRAMTKAKGAARGAFSMVLLVGAIWLLIQVFKSIESLSMEKILDNVLKMQPIMIAMFELSMISRVQGKGMRGFSMLLLVADIWMLAKVLESLKNINIEGVLPKLFTILTAMGILAIIARIMGGDWSKSTTRLRSKDKSSKISNSKGKNNAGMQILEMAAAIYIIAKAMEQIAALDPADAWRATEIVLALFGAFAVITAASALAGEHAAKVGIAIILMSASLFIIAEVMKSLIGLLEKYGPEQVWQAAGLIDSFLGMFSIVMAASKGMTAGSAAAIFGMALVLGVLTGALWLLQDIPADQLLKTAGAIGIVLVALGFSLAMISSSEFGGVGAAIGKLILVVAFLGVVTGVFYLLGKLKLSGNTMLKQAEAIGIVLVALAAAVWVLSKAKFGSWKNLGMSIAAFAAIGLVLEGLLWLLVQIVNMEGFDTFLSRSDQVVSVLYRLTPFVLALVVISAILGLLSRFLGFGTMTAGALDFAGVSAILSALFGLAAYVVGSIDNWDSAVNSMNRAITFAAKLGEFVGAIVGGAISGIGIGLTDGLPTIVDNIATAMERIKPETFDGVKAIDGSVLSGVGNLALLMMELSGAEFVDALLNNPLTALSNGVTGLIERAFGDEEASTGLQGMIDNVLDMVDALGQMSTKLDEYQLDEAGIEKVQSAIAAISAMTQIELPTTGGFFTAIGDFFTGTEISPANFALQMQTLGSGLSAFYEKVKGQNYNAEKVDKAIEAINKLVDLNSSLPKTGGLLQKFFGESGMEKFGDGMGALGKGLVSFYKAITDGGADWNNTNALDGALKIADSLASLNERLPSTGGKLQDWLGEQSLGLWAEGLDDLAVGLSGFYRKLMVNGIDWSVATNEDGTGVLDGALKIANFLAELNNAIPTEGGWLQDFLGQKSLSKFGGEMAVMGYELSMFVGYVENIGEDDVERAGYAANLVRPFLQLATDYNSVTNIWDWLSNFQKNDLFKNMGDTIESISRGIEALYTSISSNSIDLDVVDRASTSIGLLTGALTEFATMKQSGMATVGDIEAVLTMLGQLTVTKMTDQWEISALNSSLVPSLDNFKSVIHTNLYWKLYTEMSKIGKNAGEGLVYGLEAKLTLVKEAAKALGQATMDGYALGVSENEYLAVDAVTTAVNNAIQAGADAQSSASPSKEYAKLGMYGMMGYANGLLGMSSTAEDAARSVVMNSLDTVRDTISMLAAAIESDIEMDPTIRPVLDLSQLRAGASQANSLLTRTLSTVPDYARAARAGTEVNGMKATAARVKADQTGNFNSHIRELRADLHDLKDAMGQMQMVMDTGAVVGAIQKPMDRAFGKAMTYSNRRL